MIAIILNLVFLIMCSGNLPTKTSINSGFFARTTSHACIIIISPLQHLKPRVLATLDAHTNKRRNTRGHTTFSYDGSSRTVGVPDSGPLKCTCAYVCVAVAFYNYGYVYGCQRGFNLITIKDG